MQFNRHSSIYQFFWANTDIRSYFVKYLRQNILLISQCERFYETSSGKGGKSITKEKPDKSTNRISAHFFQTPIFSLVLRRNRLSAYAQMSIKISHFDSTNSCNLFDNSSIYQFFWANTDTKSYFVKYLRQNSFIISQWERFYEANSEKGGKSTT